MNKSAEITSGVSLGLEIVADCDEDTSRAAAARFLLAALGTLPIDAVLGLLAEAASSAGDVIDDMRDSGEPVDPPELEGPALVAFAHRLRAVVEGT